MRLGFRIGLQTGTIADKFAAAADESLKFWKVFEKKAGMAGVAGGAGPSGKTDMAKHMTIR